MVASRFIAAHHTARGTLMPQRTRYLAPFINRATGRSTMNHHPGPPELAPCGAMASRVLRLDAWYDHRPPVGAREDRKMRPRFSNLLLVIVALFSALAVIEIALRLFYVPAEPLNLEATTTPWDSDEAEYTPPLNEHGFREAAYGDEVLTDDFTRVLLLGDSFTFGFVITDGAKRFGDLVEDRLNLASDEGGLSSRFHVYNAVAPGTEPEEWVGYLEELLPVYRPDYVLAVFFMRDGTRLCTSLRCYEEIIDRIKNDFTERPLYKHTHLGKLLYGGLMRKVFSDYYESEVINAYLGDEEERSFWTRQQGELLQLRDDAARSGAEFHLIIFPILIELNSGYPFRQVDAEITRFAENARIPVFSMTDGFIGQDAEQLWVSKSDQHPNEKGHELAAEIIFPYIHEVLASDGRLSSDR
jgi:lysophospholipase L1-like esterase